MNNFVQKGETLTLTAPSGGVVSGTAYKIGQLLVVAQATVAEGLPFAALRTGVVTLPKDTSDTLAEGEIVYWDDGNSRLTTVASGSLRVGVGVAAAVALDETCTVFLDGIAREDEA